MIFGDCLTKALVAGNVRIYAAVTTALTEEARRRHDLTPTAAAALGRTMTGALLLAANMKNDEALTVKFAGDGAIKSITADATPKGIVRGYVGNPHVDLPLNAAGKLDVGGAVGKGTLSVTRFTGLKEPVTGSAAIVDGEIGSDLTNYLYVSEQTPSSVGLGVLIATDRTVAAAGGFVVQPLPGADDALLDVIEENLRNFGNVSAAVNDGAAPADLIEKLATGLANVEILDDTPLKFRCQCSRARIEDMLIALTEEDLLSLIGDGKAEVCCHLCGEKYRFDADELKMFLSVKRKAAKIKAGVK